MGFPSQAFQMDESPLANKDEESTPRTQTTLPQSGTPRSDDSDKMNAHTLGLCKPCLFVHTPAGCDNGDDCAFCHMQHSRKKGGRPCKAKRDRYRRLVMRRQEIQGLQTSGNAVCENTDEEY